MFSGDDCGTKIEPVDPCENVNCRNDGQCVSGICKCTPGYDGVDCSVNVCKVTDCYNEIPLCVPIPAPGGYTCSCVLLDSVTYTCGVRSIISPLLFYDNDLDITTIIPGVPGKNLTISFIDDFRIDYSCDDFLEIEGTKYCSYMAPEDITLPTGAGTQIRFFTDDNSKDVGYTLTYKYIDAVPDTNPCKNGGTSTTEGTCTCMSGFEGSNCEFTPILTSGGNYESSQDATFTLPGFPQKELVLTFDDDFSIETSSGNCSDILTNECMEDYVEIERTRYCGGMAPEPITIPTGTGTIVRFVSNREIEVCRTGFRLTYVYRDP